MEPWTNVAEYDEDTEYDKVAEEDDTTEDDYFVSGADSTTFLSDSGPEGSFDDKKGRIVWFKY